MTMSAFFPQIHKAFKDQWPVEEPTEEEISEAGSVEKARINKTKALNIVCRLLSYLLTKLKAGPYVAHPELV